MSARARDGPALIGERYQFRIVDATMDEARAHRVVDDLLKLRAIKADIAGDAFGSAP